MTEKIKIALPIIVEGRYDKSCLLGFIDAAVITTGGFSVFNNKEKQALIKKLAERDGVIILTDSDGGGRQIRSFLSGILPSGKIHNLYIPKITGKEPRKSRPSRAGTLGVEGMEKEVLLRLLSPFACEKPNEQSERSITKLDFFEDGLTGADNSSARRSELCRIAGLPDDMTAKSLIEALNLLYSYEEYKELVNKLEAF